jgi:hypothetical protein
MNSKMVLGVVTVVIAAGCIPTGNKQLPMKADPLDQGWSEADVVNWYEASQGSRLVPLAWILALEQPGSQAPFLQDDFIKSFRYEPRDMVSTGTARKVRLPRGFTLDSSDDREYSPVQTRLRWKENQGNKEPWVGMTCAACHTAEITYAGKALTVQGGPTMADFQTLIEQLDKALDLTLADASRFDRFAKAALGKDDSPASRDLLRGALKIRNDWAAKLEGLNKTDLRYGYGRLDAVGHILNKTALMTGATAPTANPSDAPVSYPFLWNVPQHDKVQWNGMATNKKVGLGGVGLDAGALGRNAGEVVGVFADIEPRQVAGLNGYISSVDVANLDALEYLLDRLKPPAWPSELFGEKGKLTETDIKDGKDLFVKVGCSDCHLALDRTDLKSPIKAQMIRFKPERPGDVAMDTDPWMACNAALFESSTGKMKGAKGVLPGDKPLGDKAQLSEMLPIAIQQALVHKKGVVIDDVVAGFFGIERPPRLPGPLAVGAEEDKKARLARCRAAPTNANLAYKARPLTGIWATAPYLHNGSVPNLYQLLLPPSKRDPEFYVGSKEFDPENVGFVTARSADNSFRFDTRLDGNSNVGHDYGVAKLEHADRMKMIAYLKSL